MIYIVRHGETDWNKAGRIQGQTDIKLNANGIKQAQELAEQVKNLPIDICICSPLSRTVETAKIIFDGEIILDKRLAERSYGSYEGGASQNLRTWDTKIKYQADIESIFAIMERTKNFLDEVKSKYNDKNVLLVTHGGTIRAMRGHLDGIPESGDLYDLPIVKNCEILSYDLLEENNEKSL
jgi:broad specificity phosphatase PhoE